MSDRTTNTRRFDVVVNSLADTPIWMAVVILVLSMLGGLTGIIALALAKTEFKGDWSAFPDNMYIMCMGFVVFALFFPMAYIVFLAKRCCELQMRVEALETSRQKPKKSEMETGNGL